MKVREKWVNYFLKNIFGSIYDFSPMTYILPNEYKRFVSEFTSSDDQDLGSSTGDLKKRGFKQNSAEIAKQ